MNQREMQDKISSLLKSREYTQQGNGRLSRRYRHPSWQKLSNPILSQFLFLHVYMHANRVRVFLELRSPTRDFTYNEQKEILSISSCAKRRYVTLFEFYNEPFDDQNVKAQSECILNILNILNDAFLSWNNGVQQTLYTNNLVGKLDIKI